MKFELTLHVNLTGDALQNLVRLGTDIFTGQKTMLAELAALRTEVAALVAAATAANANQDRLVALLKGLQAQPQGASPAEIQAVLDQIAPVTQGLVDTTARDTAA